MKRAEATHITPYLLIAPAVLLALLFSYWPFVISFFNSLHTLSLTGRRTAFIGLENYRRLFANPSFQQSLSNTLRFTLFFVPTNIAICLSAALLSNRAGKLAKLNQIFFFLPLAVGLSSSMMIIKMMFNPSIGIVNQLLRIDIQWFSSKRAAMALLVIAGVSLDIGLNFLLLSAALRNVPKSLHEVAQIEGANELQTFWYLEGPMISSTLLFVVVTNIKDAMLISAPVMILTEGGPFRATQTLVYQMYLEGFKSGNYAVGSTIATIVFSLTFLILLIFMRIEHRRVFYQ
ncbi:MAG TPA: sugar ABC transporter permease [Sphaerochaeta sp.]|nr:sugar ABC transporter permease [Sphaerochaeta sp.]